MECKLAGGPARPCPFADPFPAGITHKGMNWPVFKPFCKWRLIVEIIYLFTEYAFYTHEATPLLIVSSITVFFTYSSCMDDFAAPAVVCPVSENVAEQNYY